MKKINLNKRWKYCLKGEEDKMQEVDLPHDAMIHRDRIPKLKNGSYTGFYPSGDYIYVKKIYGDDYYIDKALILEFEGVYMDSTVFLNDVEIGGNIYGYSNFYAELTDKLIIGEVNELKVEVHSGQVPNTRWYPGNGIYRPVYLYVGEKSHINLDGVFVRTLSLEPVTIQVDTETTDMDSAEIEVEIYSRDLKVAQGKGDSCKIMIPDAKLWDEGSPNLYSAKVTLSQSGKTLDEQIVQFGIRTLSWNAEKGLLVNEKSVKLRGGCVHHDNGILGAADFEVAAYRKVRIMKEAGFNAIRSAHNPIGKNILKACDELGMYVMDEAFDTWRDSNGMYGYSLSFEEEWQDDLKKMVLKDRNHPSVIMYSTGNEISDTARPEGAELAGEMTRLCHSIDPSRPVAVCPNLFMNVMQKLGVKLSLGDGSVPKKEDVTDPLLEAPDSQMGGSVAINILMMTGPYLMKLFMKPRLTEKGSGDAYANVDIAGYNYGERVYKGHHKIKPERIIVGSETHPPTIAHNWKLVKENPYVIGDFMWTGWDYLGEVGVGVIDYGKNTGVYVKPYPSISAYTGAINLIGHRELYSHLAAIVWGFEEKPFIAVQPLNHFGEKKHLSHYRFTDAVDSWTWPGYEGNKTVVEVFSLGERVELIQNGTSLGKKKLKDFCAKFKTVYKPGKLEAISYDTDGREIHRSTIKTAGSETVLKTEIENKSIRPNGEDLCYINVSLADEKGTLKMMEEAMISVEADGAGVLQAVGSGNPKPKEPYVGNRCKTYQGRAQIIVRSSYHSGKIQVRISADDFLEELVEIVVQ